MALQTGDMAPDFTLPSTVGDKITLSDYRGKKNVVLLFYPLDFSPVCSGETKECAQMMPTGKHARRRGHRHLRRLALDAQGVRRRPGHRVSPRRRLPPQGGGRREIRRLPGREGHLGPHGLHHRQGRQDQGDRRRRHPGRPRHRRDPRASARRVAGNLDRRRIRGRPHEESHSSERSALDGADARGHRPDPRHRRALPQDHRPARPRRDRPEPRRDSRARRQDVPRALPGPLGGRRAQGHVLSQRRALLGDGHREGHSLLLAVLAPLRAVLRPRPRRLHPERVDRRALEDGAHRRVLRAPARSCRSA